MNYAIAAHFVGFLFILFPLLDIFIIDKVSSEVISMSSSPARNAVGLTRGPSWIEQRGPGVFSVMCLCLLDI